MCVVVCVWGRIKLIDFRHGCPLTRGSVVLQGGIGYPEDVIQYQAPKKFVHWDVARRRFFHILPAGCNHGDAPVFLLWVWSSMRTQGRWKNKVIVGDGRQVKSLRMLSVSDSNHHCEDTGMRVMVRLMSVGEIHIKIEVGATRPLPRQPRFVDAYHHCRRSLNRSHQPCLPDSP